jgi:hypothetical protein
MSDLFLDQGIKTQFCVKLGKNANDACTLLYEDYREEAMKKSSVF